MKLRRLVVFVPLVLTMFMVLPAFGNTITVTNVDDSGPGSLRNALALALSGDTVDFSLTYPATITLASTLNISTSLMISGPGASDLSISGNNAVTVIHVTSGATVSISGVTIQNGSAYLGGGINNDATINLSDSTVSSNVASGFGGGIYTRHGNMTLTNSTVENNSARYYGGGISSFDGTLTIINSTVSGNSTDFGGGVVNNNATLTLNDSIVSDNRARYGGGIFNYGRGKVTIANSTISRNSTGNDGGGIYNYDYGTTALINSTVSGNSSGYRGGAVLNIAGATLTLANATIAGNSATYGGGISNQNATLVLKSTIVADSSGGNCSLSGGSATSDGYNLSSDLSCSDFLNSVTDQNNISAGLDFNGLGDNGGPTETIALLSTSPATNAIPAALCTLSDGVTPVAEDQRGIIRPQGSACDVGAYELVESVPLSFFSTKLDLHGQTGFDLNVKFMLGASSNGIDPLAEVVQLQLGSYEMAIPAGSFHQLEHGKKQGSYVFSGEIVGASISVQIVPLGANSYQFKASGSEVNLNGVMNPVPLMLTIGEDVGTTSVYGGS